MTYRPTKQLTPSALATLQSLHGRKSNERHWERWDERDTESVRLLSAQGYSMRAIATVMETGTAQVQGALRGARETKTSDECDHRAQIVSTSPAQPSHD